MPRGRPEKEIQYKSSALARLAFAMRQTRQNAGVTVTALAKESAWSTAVISEAEGGEYPISQELVEDYEHRFGSDGLLLSLYSAYIRERERHRRRRRLSLRESKSKKEPQDFRSDEEIGLERRGGKHDGARFMRDVIIPDDTILSPGERFVKKWEIVNHGEIVWKNRYLERQGPATGPAVASSPQRVPIKETAPGEHVVITVPMVAPLVEGTSISHWKMTYEDGVLCFPDKYFIGLGSQITVRLPPEAETGEE